MFNELSLFSFKYMLLNLELRNILENIILNLKKFKIGLIILRYFLNFIIELIINLLPGRKSAVNNSDPFFGFI